MPLFSAEGWVGGAIGDDDSPCGELLKLLGRGMAVVRKSEERTADSGGLIAARGAGDSREEVSLPASSFSAASWAGGVIGENDGPRGGVVYPSGRGTVGVRKDEEC